MYNLNDKEAINEWRNHCNLNYDENKSKEFFNLYMKNMYLLDLEELITKKIDTSYVNTAYGNLNSNVLFVLYEKSKNVVDTLDDILTKAYNKNLRNFCSIFYIKTDTELNDEKSKAMYDYSLDKEIETINPRLIINFTNIDVKFTGEVHYYSKLDLYMLADLYNKKELSSEEQCKLKSLKASLWYKLKLMKKYI